MNRSIIEKVRKLMAMAEDSSSPNEAAIAARRARILMDKYQLDHDDIEHATQEFADAIAGTRRRFVALWEQSLAINIANLNDCQVRYTDYKQFKFEGMANDAEVCRYMFYYLTRAAKRQCSEYLKGEGYTRYNARLGTAWKLGFAYAIRDKINEMVEEREKMVTATGKGLVVVKMGLVHQHFGVAKYGSAKTSHRADPEATTAHANGHKAGQRQSVHTGIGSDASGGTKAIEG